MPPELKEGIDNQQWEMIERILRIRKAKTETGKTQLQEDDIAKWFAIWRILFPHIPEPSNPCRYYYSYSKPPLN
jgi:hypothetical protein